MARRNSTARTVHEREARERALAALALMRREGKSRSAAAKAKGTTTAAMLIGNGNIHVARAGARVLIPRHELLRFAHVPDGDEG
jgi:hypothetical protein